MALMSRAPVVFLTFADVKRRVKRCLRKAAEEHTYLMDSEAVTVNDRLFLDSVSDSLDDDVAMS